MALLKECVRNGRFSYLSETAIKHEKGLPTYEEHLMINGSKSSLHHLAGSNQRINRGYHQPGIISRSKQSLNEFYPPPAQPRSSLTNDDLLVSWLFKDFLKITFRHHHRDPSTTMWWMVALIYQAMSTLNRVNAFKSADPMATLHRAMKNKSAALHSRLWLSCPIQTFNQVC